MKSWLFELLWPYTNSLVWCLSFGNLHPTWSKPSLNPVSQIYMVKLRPIVVIVFLRVLHNPGKQSNSCWGFLFSARISSEANGWKKYTSQKRKQQEACGSEFAIEFDVSVLVTIIHYYPEYRVDSICAASIASSIMYRDDCILSSNRVSWWYVRLIVACAWHFLLTTQIENGSFDLISVRTYCCNSQHDLQAVLPCLSGHCHSKHIAHSLCVDWDSVVIVCKLR